MSLRASEDLTIDIPKRQVLAGRDPVETTTTAFELLTTLVSESGTITMKERRFLI